MFVHDLLVLPCTTATGIILAAGPFVGGLRVAFALLASADPRGALLAEKKPVGKRRAWIPCWKVEQSHRDDDPIGPLVDIWDVPVDPPVLLENPRPILDDFLAYDFDLGADANFGVAVTPGRDWGAHSAWHRQLVSVVVARRCVTRFRCWVKDLN